MNTIKKIFHKLVVSKVRPIWIRLLTWLGEKKSDFQDWRYGIKTTSGGEREMIAICESAQRNIRISNKRINAQKDND